MGLSALLTMKRALERERGSSRTQQSVDPGRKCSLEQCGGSADAASAIPRGIVGGNSSNYRLIAPDERHVGF